MSNVADPADILLAAASRPLIVSDIDGVLAMLPETIATAVNARFGTALRTTAMTAYQIELLLPPEQSAWLRDQFLNPVFFANTAPDLHAIAALGSIRDAGYHVTVATDRHPSLEDETVAWLDRWSVGRDGTRVGNDGKRSLLENCTPQYPGILFDDDPGRWITTARPGVEVWSPRMPWTPANWQHYTNVRVFDQWSQVLGWLGIVQYADDV